MTKPKLLWHSNASWSPTGYGQQTALATERLVSDYEVAISAFFGLEGARLSLNENIKVYPGWGQSYGNESLPQHALRFFGEPRGGTIVTLMDVWVLDATMAAQFDMVCWVPVDHDPAPPLVKQFFDKSGAVPIAMTRWGQERLEKWRPLYCPHGVDLDIYKPHDQKECRKAAGLPEDAFIVGMVAANKGWPSRKCLPQCLEAWAVFHERHPDTILYLHTEPHGKVEGVNLPALMEDLGLNDGSILFVDEYRYSFDPYSPAVMAKCYGAMDVLLAPSMGEGFGLPVLEANACGISAIVSDFSAQPEVLGSGWTVEGRKTWTKQNSWQILPDVEDIIEALNRSYAMPAAAREQMAVKGVEHAQDYEIDHVIDTYMRPALADARERFHPEGLKVVAA